MMLRRKHIPILDVVAVLIFSLLANYILPLNIEFGAPVDWMAVLKLLLLALSAFRFYLTVDSLKTIAAYSNDEFNAETILQQKANVSIDDRYARYYAPEARRIHAGLVFSAVCLLLFFFVEPLAKWLR
jgi:hypothetical protein